MSLETLVAGRYTNTYNAVDTGITRDGYTLDQGLSAEVIDETDAFGGSVIDYVYRGGNVFLSFVSKAYKAGSITPFWPWATALGTLLTTAAPLGRLASALAAADVLTAVANTPAAAAPASLTANLAILAPNSSASLLFNSKVREVPVRLQCLPFDATGGTFKWFA